MSNITVRRIDFGSDEYKEELGLRNEVLRQPLGLDIKDDDLSSEADEIHIGAFDLGLLIGAAVLAKKDGYFKLKQVAVSEAWRSRGVGKRMCNFAEQIAQKEGFARICLHSRKTAVGFYEKLGYSAVGEEFFEIGLPHMAMEKYLT